MDRACGVGPFDRHVIACKGLVGRATSFPTGPFPVILSLTAIGEILPKVNGASAMTTGAMMDGREETNNFTLVRILAALTVIYSHSFELLGQLDTMERWLPFSFGSVAVSIFFVLSGFLVTKSYARRKNLTDFVEARALRIVPGLWIMLVLSIPLVALANADAEIVARAGHYLISNMFIIFPAWYIPGAFSHLHSAAINGSLWTLRYEVACYALVGIAGVAGAFRRLTVALPIIALACLAFWFARIPHFPAMDSLFLAFAIGAAWGLVSDTGKAPIWFVPIAFAMFAIAPPLLALPFVLGSLLFFLGFVPLPKLAHRLPDISYGLYIYAFPIQQSLYQLRPGMTAIENWLAATVLTATLATASWFLIERPALRAKGSIASLLAVRWSKRPP